MWKVSYWSVLDKRILKLILVLLENISNFLLEVILAIGVLEVILATGVLE